MVFFSYQKSLLWRLVNSIRMSHTQRQNLDIVATLPRRLVLDSDNTALDYFPFAFIKHGLYDFRPNSIAHSASTIFPVETSLEKYSVECQGRRRKSSLVQDSDNAFSVRSTFNALALLIDTMLSDALVDYVCFNSVYAIYLCTIEYSVIFDVHRSLCD